MNLTEDHLFAFNHSILIEDVTARLKLRRRMSEQYYKPELTAFSSPKPKSKEHDELDRTMPSLNDSPVIERRFSLSNAIPCFGRNFSNRELYELALKEETELDVSTKVREEYQSNMLKNLEELLAKSLVN